jgi:GH15 family glucan-1,4-alpha-glucosidase
MPAKIEDYAIIGNCETAALVSRAGSIDWLCLPRFDSSACFAAILGDDNIGRWLITPIGKFETTRCYRHGTLILETSFKTATGEVKMIDCMSRRDGVCDVVRRIHGVSGTVKMHTDIVIRFDYGATVPWVSREDDGSIRFVAGPDRVILNAPVTMHDHDLRSTAEFDVSEGDCLDFSLSWSLSYRPISTHPSVSDILKSNDERWTDWTSRFEGAGDYSEIVLRSLITLKALTHFETGGIVAAATTSLPEAIGGPRNWDYRYCWLRDATLSLYALIECNFIEEANAWQQWLLRAVAGSPAQLQIMYGLAGERRLDEWEIPWLAGYENSKPVRIGNAAAGQVQLDVYGEVMNALYFGRTKGMASDGATWALERALIDHLAKIWAEPDDGIWEQRGGKRHFTHSKVMAWVAIDRAIRSAETFGLEAPLKEWHKLRAAIHADVCEKGYNQELGCFVQSYGSNILDAALLMIPLVDFLPADDPRVKNTIAMIEKTLLRDGFVARYENAKADDGLPGSEGVFLACSFWLADNYILLGRLDDAKKLFDRLTALCNDVGLLSEEYDPVGKRQIGNFPQAFSHIGLINTAFALAQAHGQSKGHGSFMSAQTELANAG